jgi:hypothetical protein
MINSGWSAETTVAQSSPQERDFTGDGWLRRKSVISALAEAITANKGHWFESSQAQPI